MATSIQNMPDPEYDGWLDAFIATISGNLASYPGIVAGDMTTMGNFRDTFSDDLLAHDQAEAARKSATITKNGLRKISQDEAIRLKNLTMAHGCSEAALAALNFPSSGGSGESVSVTVPVATVDTSERLRHTIHFLDAAAAGNKRKPKGVVGVQIYHKIDGPPPGSDKDCVFLGLDTATPYVVEYDAAHAGKMVHYMLRWLMKDGSVSAWGETVSATITG